MNISDCLDNSFGIKDKVILVANSVEEIELLDSISKLLYKTKSVRSAINIIDRINQSTDLVEVCGLPTSQIVFGFDPNKPIGYIHCLDKRNPGIKHNLFGMKDDNNIKIHDSVKNSGLNNDCTKTI